MSDVADVIPEPETIQVDQQRLAEKKIKKRRAKRKTNTDRLYFNSNTQAAIVKFQSCFEKKDRDKLYNEEIKPAFDKLVENLINIHKFAGLHDSASDLKNDCTEYLFETIRKFDSKRGTNAFSYFNVVAKNWLIVRVKQKSASSKKYVSFDDPSDATAHEMKCILMNDHIRPSYMRERELAETRILVVNRFTTIKNALESDQEKKLIDAILTLLSSFDDIDIISKQAVSLYIREMTGMQTKHISMGMSKIKRMYAKICINHPTLKEES